MHSRPKRIISVASISIALIAMYAVVALSLFTATVSAQSTFNPSKNPDLQYTLLEPLPCVSGSDCAAGKEITSIKFEMYLRYAFNLFIALAAVAAVFMIVWGGFKYTTTDSFYGKNEGKTIIWNAVQGLLLVLCSFLILRTIDPRLVDIPVTIVRPLNVNISRTGITGFLNQLAARQSFGAYRAEAYNNLARAESTVADLVAQRDALQSSYKKSLQEGSGDEEELNKLQIEIGKLDYQIEIVNIDAVMQSSWLGTLGTIDSSADLISTPRGNTVSAVQSHMENVNDVYDAAVNHLRYVSNPPDPNLLQELEDEKNFALGLLTMQKAAIEAGDSYRATLGGIWGGIKGSFAGATTINPVKVAPNIVTKTYDGYKEGYQSGATASFSNRVGTDVIRGYADKITNPALKNELIEAANQVIKPQP